MSKLIDRKCPVCGHGETRVAGAYGDMRQCELCGTSDSTARFPETEMGEMLRTAPVMQPQIISLLDVPTEVFQAADVIEKYFYQRAHQWKFGRIQSRED